MCSETSRDERIVDNLNRAHHAAMAADPSVWLIGEDLLDPYGGAFKVARGLSSAFPDRVLCAPISECGFTGFACGLALDGQKPIVEIMFGDFIGYAFDPLWNLAAKSVRMYGQRLPIHLVVRCPVGGNRGYGATHSQSPQKHFLGIPDLELYEINPFHDNRRLLPALIDRGNPCILFENKTLYGRARMPEAQVDDIFSWQWLDELETFAVVSIDAPQTAQVVLIAPGSVFYPALEAARTLFLEHDIELAVLTPAQLYPFPALPLGDLLRSGQRVLVADEGLAGGSWATEVAHQIHRHFWDRLERPVVCVHSTGPIIPCARHLERQALIQSADIVAAVLAETSHA